MSVLKYVPERDKTDGKGEILKSALLATIVISVTVLLATEGMLLQFHDVPWRISMQIAFLGIPVFSINKVLLNYLNAIYEFTVFAIFQSMRSLVLTGVLAWIALVHSDPDFLAYAFPVSELMLCFSIIMYLLLKKKGGGKIRIKWMKDIVFFGLKISFANLVAEMNTKADVVCLGFLIEDTAQIGVYSFAILFTEGFYTLYLTVRKIVTPRISEFNVKGNLQEYVHDVNKLLSRYLAMGSIFAYVLVLSVYYMVSRMFNSSEYSIALIYIAVICLSIAINGKSIIWGDYLSQVGFPIEESKVNILTIASNIGFNIILILCLGTLGAAMGTAASYFVYDLAQKRYINRTGGRL